MQERRNLIQKLGVSGLALKNKMIAAMKWDQSGARDASGHSSTGLKRYAGLIARV